ncbi:MAG: universal stress protein [Acidobacteriota bacterium]
MKILIAYDGSGYSHSILRDLEFAGLPNRAEVLMISVSEAWLSPTTVDVGDDTRVEDDTFEYFRKHSEQMDRNLEGTRGIIVEAKEELQRLFPKWIIDTESTTGSPGQAILQRAVAFSPDLIAVGARGLSSDTGSGLGSVAQKILSESQIPVRIVRGNVESDSDRLKIAICFDNSPRSLEAVETVALRYWRGKPDFRLYVITDPLVALIPGRAFQVIPGIPEGRMKGEEKWVKFLAEKGMKILRNAGLAGSVHIYSGNPRVMLVNETNEWKADTIFIGKNSQRSNSLGCVASAVASRASCTVETIIKR